MNLYLVLALALGAVSAAPSAPPRLTSVVAESRLSSQSAVSLAVRRSPLAVRLILGQRPTANPSTRRSPAPPLLALLRPAAEVFQSAELRKGEMMIDRVLTAIFG